MSDNSPEQLRTSKEHGVEAKQASTEQLEKLSRDPEKSAEKLSPRDAEARAERSKIEALESAISVEAGGKEKLKTTDPASQTRRRGPIGKKQRDTSYKRTMRQVQSELKPGSRLFSKIIHNKAIEKTSEVIGSTVARPNAILAGAISAFVLTLIMYTIAKSIGYTLSGFEAIAAFIVGWVAGAVFDYLRILITGKKS